MPQILLKFKWCHPLGVRQIQMDMLKLAIFDQYLAVSQKRCKIGTLLSHHVWYTYAGCSGLHDLFNFGEITDNISGTVQDRDSYNGRLIGNHRVACGMIRIAMILSNLNVTFALWNLSDSHTLGNTACIIRVYTWIGEHTWPVISTVCWNWRTFQGHVHCKW